MECVSDVDCPSDRACIDTKCVNPCAQDSPCAPSAKCSVEQHQVQCTCPSGERGDPRLECRAIGCRSNDECPPERACINQQCQDPCQTDPCGVGAHCVTQAHNYTCSCPEGHKGQPSMACLPQITACIADRDCGAGLVCVRGVCTNPCKETRPCAPNAECTVQETRPIKSVTCFCPPGFTGDAQVQCRKSMSFHLFHVHHAISQDVASIICVCVSFLTNNANLLTFKSSLTKLFFRFNSYTNIHISITPP